MRQTTTQASRTGRTRRQANGLMQAVQEALVNLTRLPSYEEAPELYRDWGEEGEFKVEVGQGECAQ